MNPLPRNHQKSLPRPSKKPLLKLLNLSVTPLHKRRLRPRPKLSLGLPKLLLSLNRCKSFIRKRLRLSLQSKTAGKLTLPLLVLELNKLPRLLPSLPLLIRGPLVLVLSLPRPLQVSRRVPDLILALLRGTRRLKDRVSSFLLVSVV